MHAPTLKGIFTIANQVYIIRLKYSLLIVQSYCYLICQQSNVMEICLHTNEYCICLHQCGLAIIIIMISPTLLLHTWSQAMNNVN